MNFSGSCGIRGLRTDTSQPISSISTTGASPPLWINLIPVTASDTSIPSIDIFVMFIPLDSITNLCFFSLFSFNSLFSLTLPPITALSKTAFHRRRRICPAAFYFVKCRTACIHHVFKLGLWETLQLIKIHFVPVSNQHSGLALKVWIREMWMC